MTREDITLRRNRQRQKTSRRYYVPDYIWSATCRFLNNGVPRGHERLVLWAGAYGCAEAYVTTIVVPFQHTSPWSSRVPFSAMQEVSEVMRRHDLLVLAQVHSHPNNAFHSDGDDKNAVGFLPGFLSIVVPRYADDCAVNNVAIYRYKRMGQWEQITGPDAVSLLYIEPSIIDLREGERDFGGQ